MFLHQLTPGCIDSEAFVRKYNPSLATCTSLHKSFHIYQTACEILMHAINLMT